MSKRVTLFGAGVRVGVIALALCGGAGRLYAVQTPSDSEVARQRTLLDTYCVPCHNAQRPTAGLMLDTLDLAQVGRHAEVWEKVARKLRAGAMPPAGARRPDAATYAFLIASLENRLDRAAITRAPGGPVVRRLNRLEYTNAIRDLL